ncbi:MAG: transglutaminase domain-containing protein [Cytophagales bacterium]|nr:DUF3857 and transglutaminase domain-containing protein [Bernardetiaceae bacterium]MDW8203900.1 transglutaminase domain-containing protein [Cytophagales bacterium]
MLLINYRNDILIILSVLFLATSSWAKTLSPTVITLKKRVLHIRLINDQLKITADNVLVIQHGQQRTDLSPLERVGYSKFNRLLSICAFTVTPRGDTLRVTKFSDQSAVQSGVFYDDYMERVFLFPGVIAGAISYLYYTEELIEPHFLGSYYFNSYLPVLQSEFEIYCDKQIQLAFASFNVASVSFQQKKQRKQQVYQWKATHVPVFQKAHGETNISYRAPHVIPRIAYYKLADKTKVPILATLKDLYTWYSTLLDSTEEKTHTHLLMQLVDSLTAGINSTEAKAKAIFHWVQQNIQYVAFEDGYGGLVPRKATEVLRKRYGDCKDMTALLVALMRRAGIEAYFAWIGTRRLPYRYLQLPTPMTDNHMIAAAKIDNRWLFLDATDPELPFGLPSAMIQGKETLIGTSRHTYEVTTIPIANAAQSVLYDSAQVILAPDTVRVSGYISGSGYMKGELTGKNPLLAERTLLISQWETQPRGSSDTLQTITYRYQQHHAVIIHNNQLYFNPHTAFAKYQEKWMPPQHLSRPWELEYAFTLRQRQWIELPAGWQLAWLPANASEQHAAFGFDICYEKKAGGILVNHMVFVNTLSITEQQLSEWQTWMENYRHHLRQNIILYPIH